MFNESTVIQQSGSGLRHLGKKSVGEITFGAINLSKFSRKCIKEKKEGGGGLVYESFVELKWIFFHCFVWDLFFLLT